MKKKKNYYVVWDGFQKGVFATWEECQKQISGYPNAKYKAFSSLLLAEEAFIKDCMNNLVSKNKTLDVNLSENDISNAKPIMHSISVDAACDVSRGIMEYRGVSTWDKKVIFKQGPFQNATNNIGEFLAIVHALAYCKRENIDLPIYSDSSTALVWVRKKKANTKQELTENNTDVFNLISRAEKWLTENNYSNPLLKWQTDLWGEIPADYGRK